MCSTWSVGGLFPQGADVAVGERMEDQTAAALTYDETELAQDAQLL
jgi:hypothetical protein